MQTTHYLFRMSQSYSLKNKLEKAVYEYLKSISGSLIEAQYLNEVKSKIISKINQLNAEHKRCKPLHPNFSNFDRSSCLVDQSSTLEGVYSVCVFKIHKCELKHPTQF